MCIRDRYVERQGANGKVLVGIDSGANVNFDRLRHVAERAELGEKREAIIAVTIPEQPGSFKAFCEALGKRQITEFNYRYHSEGEARIFVGVQTHPENDPRAAPVSYTHLDVYKRQPLVDRLASVWLPGYRAVIQAKALNGLEEDETSGLTYNPATGTLFTVTGKNPLLVELSREGEVLRRIQLKGFSDPEAVEMMDNGRMAIVDEDVYKRQYPDFQSVSH